MPIFSFQQPLQQVQDTASIIESWSSFAQRTAKKLIHEYGNPHEATANELIWHYNGPWYKTVLRSSGPYHNFPYSHTDILEQSVQRFVPLNKYLDLMRYNGSIKIDRTAGFLIANCDSEAMNFLTINIANEIIIGNLTVEEARKKHMHITTARKMHWPEPFTEGLSFLEQSFINTPTAYPDRRSVATNGVTFRSE